MDNSTLTSSLTISYRRPGTVPPVFVAGSFTDTIWTPVELDHEPRDHGEYQFRKTFQVSPGVHQYKLRLGHGDWWICDESRATGDDGQGNTNNIVIVKPALAPTRKESLNHVQLQEDMQPAADPSPTAPSSTDKMVPVVNDQIKRENQVENMPAYSTTPAAINGHVVEPSRETHASQKSGSVNTSNISLTGSQEPLLPVKDTMDGSRSAREKAVSQHSAPSLSTEVSFQSEDDEQERFAHTKDGTRDEQDKQDRDMPEVKTSMVYRICSRILCGRSRKHAAVALTTILLPLLAWYFYAA